MDLPLIFGVVAAFCIAMYVILDGFDLGVGILFPLAGTRAQRDLAMNSIAPFWDGNETWLVLGGALLFAAFPAAYAALLPALYLPLMVMLFALVFRGVAFEFRFKAERSRRFWDYAFAAGSTLAAFAQGVMLGAFIEGIEPGGGAFAWLSPFGLVIGIAVVAGYGLLGAAWLVMKTQDETRELGRAWARRLLMVVLAGIGIVSLWTPLADPVIAERWFRWPNLIYLSPVPLVTAGAALALWRALDRADTHAAPFLCAVALFLLSYAGLGISLWPWIVPRTLTLHDAAADPATLAFVGVGVAIVLPIILAYTAYAYWVFRGKTADHSGYHH